MVFGGSQPLFVAFCDVVRILILSISVLKHRLRELRVPGTPATQMETRPLPSRMPPSLVE